MVFCGTLVFGTLPQSLVQFGGKLWPCVLNPEPFRVVMVMVSSFSSHAFSRAPLPTRLKHWGIIFRVLQITKPQSPEARVGGELCSSPTRAAHNVKLSIIGGGRHVVINARSGTGPRAHPMARSPLGGDSRDVRYNPHMYCMLKKAP